MFCDPDVTALHAVLFAVLAGAFGWKAATELQLSNPTRAVVLAVVFGLLGPWALEAGLAEKGTTTAFQFGGIYATIGLSVVGCIASWILEPKHA